jgi:Mrp family chromosome partitioning ATPase/capsular polysaccharide biosynthesis protein
LSVTAELERNAAPTFTDYLRVLRQRKGIIFTTVLVVVLVAVGLSVQEGARYAAQSEVLVGLGRAPGQATQRFAPERVIETQAALGRVPAVARRTLRAAGVTDATARDFLAASKVKSDAQHDVLVFRVSDESPRQAIRLATEYARQFILYRRELDKGRYVRQVGDAFLVAAANRAAQTDPQMLRNLVLGVALGLLAGVLLAFLANAVDPRLRSGIEIADRLGLPLLGRITKSPARLRWQERLLRLRQMIGRIGFGRRRLPAAALDPRDQLIMLAEPNGSHAESFRMLRTNLEFSNVQLGSQLIMLTSATPEEGKSTAAANLAVAMARTGRRVILADLDMRRPSFEHMFGFEGHPGLADVVTGRLYRARRSRRRPAIALGRVYVSDALRPVDVGRVGDFRANSSGTRGEHGPALDVLPAGSTPPDVGEFFASSELGAFLATLKERADIVLIDGPPLLGTSDGLALSAHVDALAVVARADEGLPVPVLAELRRVLAICKCHKLGVTLTNVSLDELYRDSISGDSAVAASLERSERTDTAGAYS